MHTRARHKTGRTDSAPAAVQAARRAVQLNIQHGAFAPQAQAEGHAGTARQRAARLLQACVLLCMAPPAPALPPLTCRKRRLCASPGALCSRKTLWRCCAPQYLFQKAALFCLIAPEGAARHGAGNAASGLARRGAMHVPGKCGTIGTGYTAAGPARRRRINMHETECFYERVRHHWAGDDRPFLQPHGGCRAAGAHCPRAFGPAARAGRYSSARQLCQNLPRATAQTRPLWRVCSVWRRTMRASARALRWRR